MSKRFMMENGEWKMENEWRSVEERAIGSVTASFVEGSKSILADDLVGVYLHGSAAMGCFNAKKSDVDLIVVVERDVSDEVKRAFMDMAVALNARAPEKGIEFSVVTRDVCRPFVYPTPFILHFSVAHLKWYSADPADYVKRMNGTDIDLAAHFTVIRARGMCLYGEAIDDVFGEVDPEYYIDSIWNDVKDAGAEIATNPTYVILNLCRVLAYLENRLVLSKKEGGAWGLESLPERYRGVIQTAICDYTSDAQSEWDDACAREFAAVMTGRIKTLLQR